MPSTDPNRSATGRLFPLRNLLLLAAAVITIGAGYAVLSSGSPEAASVLLVVGYCVLFPLALIA
jgi:hypothetical protein